MYRPSPETLITGAITVAVVILVALLLATQAQAEPITGRASVIDGDTLEIRGSRIRLQGVDAPETAQICQDATGKDYRCGQTAALALSAKIGSGTVSCEPIETDKYGRTVAICRLGSLDLNGWLVSEGLAVAYRQYSEAYVPQEAAARAAKRGLWAGTFMAPWDWRHRGEARTNTPTAASCAIKGNVSRAGARIYHLPSSHDYALVKITERNGERWFCSEDEAKAAGWRAAQEWRERPERSTNAPNPFR